MKVSYGHKCKTGAHGALIICLIISICAKIDINANLNKACAELLPRVLFDNYLQIHILHLLKSRLLDKQTTWQQADNNNHLHDLTSSITSFLTIALRTNQLFIINDKKYTLNIGDCVVFDPEHPHEIKPVRKDETYLVVILNKTIAKEFVDEH
ncbi:hypothetical protein CVPH_0088 [Abyssogena phaseoliformis symbiont OG214]|uniref:hypothetical protein n=1 Tax=Abyssogena phaseoliformis symbiont TaxID=596095 RepID=UPI0019163BFF|nr:hypothetical protein [Abyssogena phaseoliformis symbiont]BBB22284.1 hypothetical protein CVPH_0088 [Abyssogena phaseoliformis symbiont OG214]